MSIGSNNSDNLDVNSFTGSHLDATTSYSSGGLAQNHFQVMLEFKIKVLILKFLATCN